MKIKEYLNEANYVASSSGVTIKITGFKKGDDTDAIGSGIYSALSKSLKSLNKEAMDKDIKEINIRLK